MVCFIVVNAILVLLLCRNRSSPRACSQVRVVAPLGKQCRNHVIVLSSGPVDNLVEMNHVGNCFSSIPSSERLVVLKRIV